MMKKAIPIVICIAMVLMVGALFNFSQDTFDQEHFDEDVAAIKAAYIRDQDVISSIVKQMQANPEIEEINVDAQQERLYSPTGPIEDFHSIYPEISSLVARLSPGQAHSFRWDDLDQQMILYFPDPALSVGRYCDQYFTSFHLQFSEAEPSTNGPLYYCEKLSDGCWLIANNYPVE